jgi:hypothetical protein
MNDPIVEEVRKVRDAHAAKFNYDLDAIFRDIKEQERNSGRTFVSFARANVEPRSLRQTTGTPNSAALGSESKAGAGT